MSHSSDLVIEEGQSRSPLEDFIIESAVRAFAAQYEPCDDEMQADEVYTIDRLRHYFNAYPRNVGDPLSYYVDGYLRSLGFKMHHSMIDEPAIFVRRKI